jgi:hypothetical protein
VVNLKLRIIRAAETGRFRNPPGLSMERATASRHCPFFCCGLLQGEKKNINVFVEQMDGVTGILPEALLSIGGFVVPQTICLFRLVNGLGHYIDFGIHLRLLLNELPS